MPKPATARRTQMGMTNREPVDDTRARRRAVSGPCRGSAVWWTPLTRRMSLLAVVSGARPHAAGSGDGVANPSRSTRFPAAGRPCSIQSSPRRTPLRPPREDALPPPPTTTNASAAAITAPPVEGTGQRTAVDLGRGDRAHGTVRQLNLGVRRRRGRKRSCPRQIDWPRGGGHGRRGPQERRQASTPSHGGERGHAGKPLRSSSRSTPAPELSVARGRGRRSLLDRN